MSHDPSPMLIMAHVDDAGMSPHEFRVMAHICRRAGYKQDHNCHCWSSAPSIAEVTGIHIQTVRKAIKNLTEHGWLIQQTRTGQSTLLTPSTGIPINHLKRGPKPTGTLPKQLPYRNNYPTETTTGDHTETTTGDHTETTTPKGIPEGKPKKEPPHPSEDGLKFSAWFLTTLPDRIQARLPDTAQAKWAACYDDMIRIDGRTKREIFDVCKWARTNPFWEKNFQSPLKLRERDKQQVHYFDKFAIEKDRKPGQRQPETAGSPDLFEGSEKGFQPLFRGHRPDK